MSPTPRRALVALSPFAVGLVALGACENDRRIEAEVQQVQAALENDAVLQAAAALGEPTLRADDKKTFTRLVEEEVRALDRTITGVGARVEHEVASVAWLHDRMLAVREARAHLDQQRAELKLADEHHWEQQAADVEAAILLLEQRVAELEAVLHPGGGAAI